jgi:hypothetical protein
VVLNQLSGVNHLVNDVLKLLTIRMKYTRPQRAFPLTSPNKYESSLFFLTNYEHDKYLNNFKIVKCPSINDQQLWVITLTTPTKTELKNEQIPTSIMLTYCA